MKGLVGEIYQALLKMFVKDRKRFPMGNEQQQIVEEAESILNDALTHNLKINKTKDEGEVMLMISNKDPNSIINDAMAERSDMSRQLTSDETKQQAEIIELPLKDPKKKEAALKKKLEAQNLQSKLNLEKSASKQQSKVKKDKNSMQELADNNQIPVRDDTVKKSEYKFTGKETQDDLYELEEKGIISRSDHNVYGERYLDYLDAKVKNYYGYTKKQMNKIKNQPARLNYLRGQVDPNWAEANFGEDYTRILEKARGEEIKAMNPSQVDKSGPFDYIFEQMYKPVRDDIEKAKDKLPGEEPLTPPPGKKPPRKDNAEGGIQRVQFSAGASKALLDKIKRQMQSPFGKMAIKESSGALPKGVEEGSPIGDILEGVNQIESLLGETKSLPVSRMEIADFVMNMRKDGFSNAAIRDIVENYGSTYRLKTLRERIAPQIKLADKAGAKTKGQRSFVVEMEDNKDMYTPDEFREYIRDKDWLYEMRDRMEEDLIAKGLTRDEAEGLSSMFGSKNNIYSDFDAVKSEARFSFDLDRDNNDIQEIIEQYENVVENYLMPQLRRYEKKYATGGRVGFSNGSTKMGYKDYPETDAFIADARKKYNAMPDSFRKTVPFDKFLKDILRGRQGISEGGLAYLQGL